jgi:hypothetical protein
LRKFKFKNSEIRGPAEKNPQTTLEKRQKLRTYYSIHTLAGAIHTLAGAIHTLAGAIHTLAGTINTLARSLHGGSYEPFGVRQKN